MLRGQDADTWRYWNNIQIILNQIVFRLISHDINLYKKILEHVNINLVKNGMLFKLNFFFKNASSLMRG